MSKHIFVVFGTRPEAIKLFPVVNRLKATPGVKVTVCVTAQHRDMLDQVLAISNIKPDIDLDLMRPAQTLDELTARSLTGLGQTLDQIKPDRVVVQGDTATAMTGALAAYYRRIPVAHVEAGLRSGDIYAPWPEEVNRKIVATIADLHFAPTQHSVDKLLAESVPAKQIIKTGNTVVDALQWIMKVQAADPAATAKWDPIRNRHRGTRIVLVTAHRRENHGQGLQNIGEAIARLLKTEEISIVLPLHPNPEVQRALGNRFADNPRVEIISPPDYLDFVGLMDMAHIILTDSGGVQEEAPTLGKPVLVLRDNTERPEAVMAGTALLVGTGVERIVFETTRLLRDADHYRSMSKAHNPFGDGRASERIVEALLHA
jgi:UDP-N-acetylglucosamine 2-epimerase (non-hydrolysing)